MANLFKKMFSAISSPFARKSESKTVSKTYYWTNTGKAYHSSRACMSLSRSKNIESGNLSECSDKVPCYLCIEKE